jgi:hypothetical protein
MDPLINFSAAADKLVVCFGCPRWTTPSDVDSHPRVTGVIDGGGWKVNSLGWAGYVEDGTTSEVDEGTIPDETSTVRSITGRVPDGRPIEALWE